MCETHCLSMHAQPAKAAPVHACTAASLVCSDLKRLCHIHAPTAAATNLRDAAAAAALTVCEPTEQHDTADIRLQGRAVNVFSQSLLAVQLPDRLVPTLRAHLLLLQHHCHTGSGCQQLRDGAKGSYICLAAEHDSLAVLCCSPCCQGSRLRGDVGAVGGHTMRLAEILKHLVRKQGPMQSEQGPLCHPNLLPTERVEKAGKTTTAEAGGKKAGRAKHKD